MKSFLPKKLLILFLIHTHISAFHIDNSMKRTSFVMMSAIMSSIGLSMLTIGCLEHHPQSFFCTTSQLVYCNSTSHSDINQPAYSCSTAHSLNPQVVEEAFCIAPIPSKIPGWVIPLRALGIAFIGFSFFTFGTIMCLD